MVATFARNTAKVAAEEYDFPTNRDLSLLHNAPASSDVTLIVGPEKRRLYVHEHILTLSSDYFGRMLDQNSAFREARTRIVHKPNWSWEVAFALTRFMYTGRLDNVPVEILGPLYCAADEAQVEILVAEMLRRERDFVFMLCDPGSAEDLLRFSQIANLDHLAHAAAKYLELIAGNPNCQQLLYPPAQCECNLPPSADEDEDQAFCSPEDSISFSRSPQESRRKEEMVLSSECQATPWRTVVGSAAARDSPPQLPEASHMSSDYYLEDEYSLTSPEILPKRGLPDVHQRFCPLFWSSTPSRPQSQAQHHEPLAASFNRWHPRDLGPHNMPSPNWDHLPPGALPMSLMHLPYEREALSSGACPDEPNKYVFTLVIQDVPISSGISRGFTEGAKEDPVPHIAFRRVPKVQESISLEAVADVGHVPRMSSYYPKPKHSPSKPSGKEAVASLLSHLRKHTSPQKLPDLYPGLDASGKVVGPGSSVTYLLRQLRWDDMSQLMRNLVEKANPAASPEESSANLKMASQRPKPYWIQRFIVRLNLWPAAADMIRTAKSKNTGCKFHVYNESQAGYGPGGASTIDAYIEGRPAQLRKHMVLLDESLWKDANHASRASYDAKGTLAIVAPQRTVLQRIFETQVYFKYDFTLNCLILDRPPDELKRILGDLDHKIFKGGELDPAPSLSPGSAAAVKGAQRTSTMRQPSGAAYPSQPVSASDAAHTFPVRRAEWPTGLEVEFGLPSTVPVSDLPHQSLQPSPSSSVCSVGWPCTSANQSGNPMAATSTQRGQQRNQRGVTKSTSAETFPWLPSNSAVSTSSSTSAATASWNCGKSSGVGGIGGGPGRLVIKMPEIDAGVFDIVVPPNSKRGFATAATKTTTASNPPSWTVSGSQTLPAPPKHPVSLLPPSENLRLSSTTNSSPSPLPAGPPLPATSLPSPSGMCLQPIALHIPRTIEFVTGMMPVLS